MDIIFIKGLSLEAVIGIYPYEQTLKQPIKIDVDLYVDISKPSQTDLIKDTVDYDLVAIRITELVRENKFNLLESLLSNIADTLLEEFNVKKLRCTIYKPHAISKAETVGITIVREKAESRTPHAAQ